MRIAVIDLGTNTCNLLIAEVYDSSFDILHQSKELVKLGDNRIRHNEISEEATFRVLKALDIFKEITLKHETDRVRLIATSAVRTASNKASFLKQIRLHSGWDTEVVSGEQEAELIFQGVLLASGGFSTPGIILDIGGGSNELIVASGNEMIMAESQATGMARIIHQFPISDPISPEEVLSLKDHFKAVHKKALDSAKSAEVNFLVGCSGAFDTIADIIDQVDPGEKSRIRNPISIQQFYEVYEQLISSTRDERLQMKGMDMVRVDLIVPAMVLIELIVSELELMEIIHTDFALREGVLNGYLTSSA